MAMGSFPPMDGGPAGRPPMPPGGPEGLLEGLEGEEGAEGGAAVTACAARNCSNNEDGQCGLDEITVGAKNECTKFEGERVAEEEEGPEGEGPEGAGPAGPTGPMARRVPPPPAPGLAGPPGR